MALADRINERLKAMDITAEEASLRAGASRSFVGDIINGRARDPGAHKLKRLAEVLQRTTSWLLEETPGLGEGAREGYEAEPAGARPRRAALKEAPPLPVRHIVRAGQWFEDDDTAQDARHGPPIAHDARYGGEQWLEEVAGDSMDRIAPAGAFVHVVDAASIGYAPKEGDLVVVERVRAQGGLRERSLKRVKLAPRGRIELWPDSNNPKWKAPLLISAGRRKNEDIEIMVVGRVIGVYRDRLE